MSLLRIQAPREMGIHHISTTTHCCLGHIFWYKKVTHKVLHNHNHDNQKLFIFWIGVVCGMSHEKNIVCLIL